MGTLADFVSASVNRCLDLDGVYGCQCVDLADAWAADQGHPLPAVAAAKDFAGLPIPGWWWIPNSIVNHPDPGDLVVWDSRIGQYGHIALCTGPIDNLGGFFTSLDQNWINPDPDHGSVAVHVDHNYYGVAGWLRLEADMTPEELKQAIREVLDEGTPAGGSSWRGGNIDTAHKVDVLFHQLAEAVAMGQTDAKGTVIDTHNKVDILFHTVLDAGGLRDQVAALKSTLPGPSHYDLTVTPKA